MAKRTKATSESVLDSIIGTIALAADSIHNEIELIKSGKAKANGHDRGSRIAFLSSKLGSLADSVRKIEAARAKRNTDLSLVQVVAWIRQQPEDDRARVEREIQNMRRRGGVLG